MGEDEEILKIMTYDQIKQQPDKTIINAISGRCVKVFPPKEPTPAQAKAGIHPQSIVLQDDDGNELLFQLSQAPQHFASEDAGKMFHFQSMPNQRGASDGLSVNRWTNQNGEEKVSIRVDRHAHFYEIQEEGEELPVKAGNQILPPAALEVKFQPSVSSLVGLYVQIATEFELQRSKPAEHAEVSTVFIQACMNGLHKKPLLVTTHIAEEKATLTMAKLAAQVALMEVAPTDDMVRMAGGDWSALYDEVMKFKGVDDDQQTRAWEMVRKSLQQVGESTSTASICRAICTDIENFDTILTSL